jgi:hypothetical protein
LRRDIVFVRDGDDARHVRLLERRPKDGTGTFSAVAVPPSCSPQPKPKLDLVRPLFVALKSEPPDECLRAALEGRPVPAACDRPVVLEKARQDLLLDDVSRRRLAAAEESLDRCRGPPTARRRLS